VRDPRLFSVDVYIVRIELQRKVIGYYMSNRSFPCAIIVAYLFAAGQTGFGKEGVIRAGIVGCDTSHVEAFTKLINEPHAPAPFDAVEVVAAFPGGSPDMKKDSMDRVPGYVKKLKGRGIKIVDSIEELVGECDAFMLESVDGRSHLKQFRAIAKGKPVFVDKPAAGSLADLFTIYQIADETHTPVYSSSSLRFAKDVQEIAATANSKDPKFGDLLGCDAASPMSTQRFHPDLFWYGIHGVEPLFTVMHTGCETVARADSADTTVVVGKWKDGRIGTFRGIKKGYYYAVSAFGTKRVLQWTNPGPGYEAAVTAMCKFFKTGKPPVPRQETIEIYAFMEAADASKRQGGKPVKIADIIERAEKTSAAHSTSAGGDK
jgi:predicted dehydrogenase